MVKSWN